MPKATPRAKYIMVGGFLGAGKTTAILNAAQRLRDRGLRVGLITNDQSYGLVDTAMLSAHGFAVQEITGGCFCCKFNSLVEASERLSAGAEPDVFIAEPVGSCTDLKATVDYPLRRMYGDDYQVAPLSVLVDPVRAMRVLGLEQGRSFSRKVVYIYRKQLDEAEVIVVNKAELLPSDRLDALRAALAREFPNARVHTMSARTGEGVDAWVELVTSESPRLTGAMDVDYDTYAEGEALLGWLNATASLRSGAAGFDGNALLLDLARSIQDSLREYGAEVAHLKMTLTPDEDGGDIAVANVVRGDGRPEMSHTLREPLESGQLIVNLRAEGDPDLLRRLVTDALGSLAKRGAAVMAAPEHVESFRPGRPTPTHRLAGVAERDGE
jgi:Ni2+-binding GTPase involved in maturation of urease and hydrogenase